MRSNPVWRWIGLLLLLQLFTTPVVAENGRINIGNEASYALSRSFTYFEDNSTTLTVTEISQPEYLARFKPVPQGAVSTNFGLSNAAIWLRIILKTDETTPQPWLLEVAYPPLDQLDMYLSNADGGYEHQTGGDSRPFIERAIAHRNHVKPITLLPDREFTLYLRIASQGAVSAPTTLWQPAALWQSDQLTYSIFSIYFGLLIGLLLYNLLLFLSIGDRVYLVYVAFVTCIGLSQAANSGLGAQFLWPDALWWNNRSISAGHSASGVFGLLFARQFLATQARAPTLDRLLMLQVGLWLVSVVVSLTLPYKVGGLTVTFLAIVGVVSVAMTAVISIRRGHPGARFFGLAWATFLCGVVAQVMHNNGLLPSNLLTIHALLIGSALEMVLLSFALADRINVARQDTEKAQAQVMNERTLVQALQLSQERYQSVIERVALQLSQERYQSVIERVGEGMVVMQADRIVFVNLRATEILNASKADIASGGILKFVHTEDREMLAQRLQLRASKQQLQERCLVRLALPDQPIKWLELGDNNVPWDNGEGLLIFFMDVTERYKAELDSRAALDSQQEFNNLRSRFVALTSHEFRTPLTSILSSQDLLKHYHERLSEAERLKILDTIESGVHRMTRMLDRVLLLGKTEAHMLEFRPKVIDLRALCTDLVHEAQSQQPGTGCHISLDYAIGPQDGMYDDKLLRHIFSNLLSNAIKYSPSGGQVRLTVMTGENQTVFEVSDQGIGVPADEIEHLFESFHRASNVGSIAGTGLGLVIVKQAVELHGGTITVHSQVGQGTTFTITVAS